MDIIIKSDGFEFQYNEGKLESIKLKQDNLSIILDLKDVRTKFEYEMFYACKKSEWIIKNVRKDYEAEINNLKIENEKLKKDIVHLNRTIKIKKETKTDNYFVKWDKTMKKLIK